LSETKAETRVSQRFWKLIRVYSLLLVLSVIWGLAFVAIREADFELSPVNLTLLRWFIASAGFLVLAPLFGRPKTKFQRQDLPRFLVISFANVAGYHLSLNFAEVTVSSGLAGLLIAFGPVFVVMFSAYALKEKIRPRIILALIIAVAGALLLSLSNLSTSSGSLIGPLEIILAALSFAVFGVLSKPLVTKYGALFIGLWAGATGTAMLLPLLSQNFVEQVSVMSATGWFSVLYLSVLSTVLGYLMFYTLVSRGTVSKLSIQLYLVPIFSVIGGILILHEQLTVLTIVGGAALLLAIAFATQVKH